MKPIFIFSQPRSGSTLLQKILMSHDKITSIAEPWILLPLIYMQKEGQVSVYSEETCRDAIKDIIQNLSDKEKDYHRFIHDFVMNIYQNLSSEQSVYFVDKTPRYYLVIDEIMQIFPEAKVIFLFRNPVSVYASIMTTWNKNRFRKIYKNDTDIIEAPALIARGYEKWSSRSFRIEYEGLVENPENELKALFNYLELEYDDTITDKFFTQNLHGNMGDPTGSKKYKSISKESLDGWKKVFATPFRKFILKQYIKKLEEDFFRISGYKQQDILREIALLPNHPKNILVDPIHYIFGFLYNRSKIYFHFSKRFKWMKKYYFS